MGKWSEYGWERELAEKIRALFDETKEKIERENVSISSSQYYSTRIHNSWYCGAIYLPQLFPFSF